jgi:UDP-N-acetylglucosamine 2-epimerase (non-hydrolysing)
MGDFGWSLYADEVRRDLAIAYVVGARPNFVKMAPVISSLRSRAPQLRHVVIHTGQHYNREMSDVFVKELDLPEPHFMLGVGSGPHGAQTGRALERSEGALREIRPTLVIVSGDVNSTLAAALAAVKLNIPVAHVESGLRSFDRAMPEEINRVLVDQISRWCFTHSPEAECNLQAEGVTTDRIYFVGNTMIDALVSVRQRVADSEVHAKLGVPRKGYLLVTLHRPALVDSPMFTAVMTSLARVARELPVIFPVHPRTRARLARDHFRCPGLRILDPVGYVDFLALEQRATGVLTDSGGVQEETTFFRVPCFTLRNNTERPITVSQGTNRLLGMQPGSVEDIPRLLSLPTRRIERPVHWDGAAAERLADVLLPALADIDSREVPGRPAQPPVKALVV